MGAKASAPPNTTSGKPPVHSRRVIYRELERIATLAQAHPLAVRRAIYRRADPWLDQLLRQRHERP